MHTLAATFVVFLAAVLAMAIGVLVQGRRLKGSCGGSNGACTCSALAARTCPRRRASRESADGSRPTLSASRPQGGAP